MHPVARFTTWLRIQPDRPLVILIAHAGIVLLYVTGNAVSKVPFNSDRTKTLVTSDFLPSAHAVAALILIFAILTRRWRGFASGVSLFMWCCTTIILYLGSRNRVPPLAYWSVTLSLVIALAAFLMLVRWGVDGDGDERGGT